MNPPASVRKMLGKLKIEYNRLYSVKDTPTSFIMGD